jgi:hypothetical protein
MTLPSQQTPGPDHGGPRPSWPSRARKFLVAVAGLAGEVLATGLLNDPGQHTARVWVVACLGVLTAAGIYQVPNAPAGGGPQ